MTKVVARPFTVLRRSGIRPRYASVVWARRFFQYYENPRDWLTIFRSVLQLAGTVTLDGDGGLRVALKPPDRPRVRRALAALLDDINRMDGRLFGQGPKLTFVLAS